MAAEVTEMREAKSGADEEPVEQAGPVSHLVQPMLHQDGWLGDVVFT
jgi:hypothetical protein